MSRRLRTSAPFLGVGLQDARAAVGEHEGARCAGFEGGEGLGLVQAEGVGQGHRLGGGGDVDAAEQLVDGLEGLAVAGLVAHHGQGGGQQFKGRAGLFLGLGRGADHDQQVAFAGTLGAAGKRGINQLDAVFGQAGDGGRDGFGAHGAAQDHDGARLEHGGHAVLAEEDIVELLAVAHCQQQGVGALRGFPGGGERADAGLFSQLQARLGDVEAVDGELACQARGHGQAHGAEAQDGDGVVAGHGVLHRMTCCGVRC